MSEKQDLIQVIRQISEELGTKSVPRHEFLRRAKVSERKVQRLSGSYNALVQAAGLEPRRFPTADAPMYSDEELLKEVVRVLRLPNAKLTRVFFAQNAAVSTGALTFQEFERQETLPFDTIQKVVLEFGSPALRRGRRGERDVKKHRANSS